MKLYTLDGYVFVCPCAVMRLNRILRFDTCSNPQTKYWSCNHPETFKTYIIYIQGSLHTLTNHLPWTLGLPSPQVSFNCEPLAFSCNVQTTPSHRWNIMACRWSKTSGSSKLSCSWSTRSASTCRIYAMHMSQNPPMASQPHSQTVDVGEHHHRQFPVALAVANMHSSKTRTNQVLSFQPPRTYDFFGIYWDLNFQQGFVWGLHQSSDLWHSKNKDMAGDWGWLLPFECKHEQKANRPSEVHAPKEKPLPRDPKITLQMSAAGWTPLLQSHITFVFHIGHNRYSRFPGNAVRTRRGTKPKHYTWKVMTGSSPRRQWRNAPSRTLC